MTGTVVRALSLLWFFAISPAQGSEKPGLKLDFGPSQDLILDVRDVPIERLLKDLGERLNFTVDFLPQANPLAVVNGKFEGSLDEILSEILRTSSYVAQHGRSGVTHVVVITSISSPGSPGSTPTPIAGASPGPAPVAASAGQVASFAGQSDRSAGGPIANGGGARVLATTSRTK